MTERMKDLMNGRNALEIDAAVEGARRATGDAASIARPADPEVAATAKRRQFSGSERRRILAAADRCTAPGAIGALLRREGIYSSQLATWRKQRVATERARAGTAEARPQSRSGHRRSATRGGTHPGE